jgi:DNA-binding NarL/FixJ family response regulator
MANAATVHVVVARLLVVDDDPDVRAVVRLYLLRADDIEIVGESADGGEAVSDTERLRPDLILLDNDMPERTGMEVLADLRAQLPDARIVLFSTESDVAAAALANGADCFLHKPASSTEVLRALRSAS